MFTSHVAKTMIWEMNGSSVVKVAPSNSVQNMIDDDKINQVQEI